MKKTDLISKVSRKENPAGKDIRDFVPGGILTQSNFDQALRDAVAWCYAQLPATSTDLLVNGLGKFYNVLIPAGTWQLQPNPIVFPGLQAQLGLERYSIPGIIGAGVGHTMLVVMGDLPSAERGMFECGLTGGFTARQMFSRFTLAAFSGSAVGCGIVARAYRLDVDDIEITGFQAPQKYTGGFGMKLVGIFNDPVQHANLNKLRIQGCQSGLYVEQSAEVTGTDVWINQCYWRDIVLEGSSANFRSGNLQSANNIASVNPGSSWYAKSLTPCVSGGWGNMVHSGTGATLGTASYATDDDTGIANAGSCVVTGLTGLTPNDVGNWLELTGPGAFAARSDLISGLYEIVAVATDGLSCTILKGTNHSSTGSIAWKVLDCLGSQFIQISGFPYHEGDRRCVIQTDKSSLGSSVWIVDGIIGSNTIAMRCANGEVTARGMGNGGSNVNVRLVKTDKFDSDVPLNRIAYDNYSRYGMTCNYSDSVYGECGKWNGYRSFTSRANSFTKDRGGWAFDARRLDKHTLSSTDIQQVRCVSDDTIVGVPQNSGQYASYIASDSVFGTPAWNLSGGAGNGSVKNLKFTIPAAKFPVGMVRTSPTIVAVVRITNTTPTTELRRIIMSDIALNTQYMFAINEATAGFTSGNWFTMYSGPQGGGGQFQLSSVADTVPHAMAMRWDMRAAGFSGRGVGTDEFSDNTIPNLVPAFSETYPVGSGWNVYLNQDLNQILAGGILVPWMAMFPYALTAMEIDQLMDMLANEFKIAR